jgi:hypothetical protein
MARANVRYVNYSTEEGTIKREKLKNMKHKHTSKGFRELTEK